MPHGYGRSSLCRGHRAVDLLCDTGRKDGLGGFAIEGHMIMDFGAWAALPLAPAAAHASRLALLHMGVTCHDAGNITPAIRNTGGS